MLEIILHRGKIKPKKYPCINMGAETIFKYRPKLEWFKDLNELLDNRIKCCLAKAKVEKLSARRYEFSKQINVVECIVL